MAAPDETPRDLLFGLLALQNGLIDQDQLVAAFSAWSRAKGRTLAEILVERGAIDDESRRSWPAMAEKQLKLHGGDTEKSLAAVAAGPSTREKLAALGDADLDRQRRPASGSHDAGPATPRPRCPSAPPPATASGSASSGPHAQGGLGAVFVALDGELNREVALKQILDHHADDPHQPHPLPDRGRDHRRAGAPRASSRSTAWATTATAGPTTPCGSSAATRSRRPSPPSTPTSASKRDPGRRSLALRKLLRRFVDVCNAIDYAHGRGVLHRDLKPGNVIVGKHGETLVVDWGLAKPMGHAEAGSTADERTLMPSSSSGSAETLPGSAIGTPAYMSPEQAAGDLEQLGPRSDVYSLGATLYCLLTGKAAVRGDDLGAVLRDVQKGNFPPPRQVDPSIDPALEAVCLKAMATRPEDRYATARAPGRRRRAVGGRRAGLGLARAGLAAGPPLDAPAPHGGDGRRRRPCWWRSPAWRRSWRSRRGPTPT